MKKYFFSGAICVLLLSLSISAQTTDSTTNQTDEATEENSDVVITATVRAKELKMEIVPTPTVEFPGTKTRKSVWEADRENLPAKIEPNVVYRDIGIRLRIYTRFAEIQRIVLEALDETNPPTDKSTTTNQPTETVKPPTQ